MQGFDNREGQMYMYMYMNWQKTHQLMLIMKFNLNRKKAGHIFVGSLFCAIKVELTIQVVIFPDSFPRKMEVFIALLS